MDARHKPGHDELKHLSAFGSLYMPLRLIFMGTPDFAVPTLLELVAHGHEIAAVYTRAAKPAGRGMKLQPTPVEQEARRLGIPVFTPDHTEDAGSARMNSAPTMRTPPLSSPMA